MGPRFAVGDHVWLKQEGYPWWPGTVVDPTSIGRELPGGGVDLCVLCLPTTSSTLAFANSSNKEEVTLFTAMEGESWSEEETARVEAGLADPGCEPAVREAMASFKSTVKKHDEQQASQHSENDGASNEELDEDDMDLALLSIEAKHSEKSHRHKKRKREEEEKKSRRHRSKRSSTPEDADSEDENESDDGRRHRHHRHEKKKKEHSKPSRSSRREPSSDQMVMEQQQKGPSLQERLLSRRHPATDAELLTRIHGIKDSISEYPDVVQEDELFEQLRKLSHCDVSLHQLQELNIGNVVGSLLQDLFSVRVRSLAKAILSYWFHTLEKGVQEEMRETEVDNCSHMSTIGDEIDDRGLGYDPALHAKSALFSQLYYAFTEEEIDKAEVTTDSLVELCGSLESALLAAEEVDARLSVLVRVGSEDKLRMELLKGTKTAEEVVEHETRVARGFGSPTIMRESDDSFANIASPNLRPGSPLFSQETAGDQCPSCGSRDAYRSGYTVSAHDNYPEIMQCRRCLQRWNTSVA